MFEIAAFARSRSVGEKPKLLIRPTELSICHLVAEWIHFTLFGIILPTLNLKVYTFGGL